MTNSDQERRLLNSLRKNNQLWRRRRWYFLFVGAFAASCGAWLVYQTAARASSTDKWDPAVVWSTPAFWVLFIVGVSLLTSTLRQWNGNRVVELLLMIAGEAGGGPAARDVPAGK